MASGHSTIYEPLDTAKSEIRLVELLSDDLGSPVNCRISTVSLTDKPLFLALSYVWGDPKVTQDIIINDQTVPVTTNLETALRHVSRQWTANNPEFNRSSFQVWIDAICINQADLKEREQQLKLMRRIFQSAAAVLAWLGPEDQTLAFNLIRYIASEIPERQEERLPSISSFEWLRKRPDLIEEKTRAPEDLWNNAWRSIDDLLRSPYWQRVWIFQEAVLARRMHLFSSGASALDADSLKLVADGLHDLGDAISKGTVARPAFVTQVAWRAVSSPNMGWAEVRNTLMMRGLDNYTLRLFKKRLGGWALSTFAESLIATDPKDYIYGLLGITGLPIKPDYSSNTSLADLYVEYAQGWIKANRSKRVADPMGPLYFLARAGSLGNTYGLPSWVPNFPDTTSGRRYSTRVRTGNANRGVFDGDRDTYPHVRAETKSLFAWGVEVDSIVTVSEAPAEETLFDGRLVDFVADFMSRHKEYVTGIPPFQAFVRLVDLDVSQTVDRLTILKTLALIGVLSDFIQPSNAGTPLQLKTRIKRLDALGFPMHLDLDRLVVDKVFPGMNIREFGFDSLAWVMNHYRTGPIADIYELVGGELVKMGKAWRLVETKEGYLGLSSVATIPGDIVCVLDHCDVPVVLRPSSDRASWTLIGTAFVVGLMNGEAVEFIRRGRSKPRWFELR